MNNTNQKNTIRLMGSCLMNNILYMMIAYFVTLTNKEDKNINWLNVNSWGGKLG